VFSFRHLVNSHGISGCSVEDKAAVLDALHRRSALTWAQIKSAPRHGLGTEKIDQESLTVPLPSYVTPDTTILALRCIGKAPMIGFRDEDRFHVLWLEREYDCYDHS
jgi:hypothetical protein